MICTNTDHYVNTLSTIKKEKKRESTFSMGNVENSQERKGRKKLSRDENK